MNFIPPKPSLDSLDRLIEYLNNTSNYSDVYDGNRADDFNKCFDTSSEWCLILANLIVRGWEPRIFNYANIHHIIPACFYGRRNKDIDVGNLTRLTYEEHIYAHFCMVMCAHKEYKSKLKIAFMFMYGMHHKRFPSCKKLLEYITENDLNIIRASSQETVLLLNEGRTPYFKDPVQALKDYYNLPRVKERKRRQHRQWTAANREHVNEKNRLRYHANIDVTHERQQKRYEANRDNILAKGRERYWNNVEHEHERSRKYYHDNIEKEKARSKIKHAKYKEKDNARNRARYWKNKEAESLRKHIAYEKKVASGYRLRKDPDTGKNVWVFVGISNQEVA